jgi:hypothetical protein
MINKLERFKLRLIDYNVENDVMDYFLFEKLI